MLPVRRLLVAIALSFGTACQSAGGGAGSRSALDIAVPLAPAAARARVLQVFTADGLAVTESTGDVVTGTYTEKLVVMRVRGTVIPVDRGQTRIVLTGFAERPQFGTMPEVQGQVHSNTGGLGKALWARMERIAAALTATASQ